ncbi:hypothetical protein Tco_1488584 [Tanacetum coccineum]
MKRASKGYTGENILLFPAMIVQGPVVQCEGSTHPVESHHTPTSAPSTSQPPADENVYEERGDSVERAATTATSLDAEQGSGNINRTQSTAIPNDHFPQEISSGGSPKCQDTMGDRPAQTRVLDLENVKDAQALEIKKLKKRVKKLESKKKSRTPQLKRRLFKVRIESSAEKSLGDQEDASKQGRNEIDQDEAISWFQEDLETQGRYGHDIGANTASTSITTASINITIVEPVTIISAPITTAGVSVSTTEPSTPPTTTILIEDEDLIIAQTLMKMRSVKSKEKSKEKGVSSETATTTRGVTMQEPKADYELAQRLQAEEQRELTIKERSKLFVELMDKRKKHFAKLRAKEIRRKPPTKAQKRNQMCTYLKHMANYKHSQLKNKCFEEIQILFDNTIKW